MSEITVLGLGLMGAALAGAIRKTGHDLTVWNRSPARMQPFLDDGVAGAADAAAAITASPVVLICIDDYRATDALLRADGNPALLAGRTLVQLSTGTPREVQQAAAWARGQGASYLDGAILGGPPQIGTEAAQILLSGDRAAHDRAGPLLACLGATRYLGANVGAASTLDLAWLATRYGRFVALAHAANMCRSEDVGLDALIALFPEDPMLQSYLRVVHEQSFDQRGATLAVWGAALERVREQGRDAGINTEFPDFAAGWFRRANDAGHGDENVMALIKILQQR